MTRPLEIAGCRQECSWAATGADLAGERLFACAGCGSEWVATEPWTPVDWTGVVPELVQDERFMNCSRRIRAPQRSHGVPSRP